jgi:hypothetical protein
MHQSTRATFSLHKNVGKYVQVFTSVSQKRSHNVTAGLQVLRYLSFGCSWDLKRWDLKQDFRSLKYAH